VTGTRTQAGGLGPSAPGSGLPWLAPLGDAGMLRGATWLARALGFGVIALLTFLKPPHTSSGTLAQDALALQSVALGLVGLGLLAWAVLDLYPAADRYRARGLPLILGLIAVVAGFASPVGGGGTTIVLLAALATLVAASDVGLAAGLAVTAAGILATEVSGLAFGEGYGAVLGLPLLVFIGMIIGRHRGAYRVQAEQSAALLAQHEQLQSEQRRNDLLAERARLAREIHDVLAHSIGALGIQIQAARAALSDHSDMDRAGELLVAAQRMAGEGLAETRRAIHALRVDTLPLGEELGLTSKTYAQRYHVPVSFDTSGTPVPLPPDATVTLLRIAQEALVNAAKHAAGQPVAVSLDYSAADVRLTIRNHLDPRACGVSGPDADRSPRLRTVNGGYGLTGMQERIRLQDGTVEAGRSGGQWVVTAELPCAPAESTGS
jgi:signal transduction histidine kinase